MGAVWDAYGCVMGKQLAYVMVCPTTPDDAPTGPQRNVHISQNYPISKLNANKWDERDIKYCSTCKIANGYPSHQDA